MVIAGVSSMKNGAEFISCAASTTRPKSSSFTSPRRMRSEETPDFSARIRVASCSEDISSEKKPTLPPSITIGLPFSSTPSV